MFIIFRGAVEALRDRKQIGVLGEQQYFGEMAILSQNCLRTATVRTISFCELRMLTREKFLQSLSRYPSMKQRIATIIQKRNRQAKATIPSSFHAENSNNDGNALTVTTDIITADDSQLVASLKDDNSNSANQDVTIYIATLLENQDALARDFMRLQKHVEKLQIKLIEKEFQLQSAIKQGYIELDALS